MKPASSIRNWSKPVRIGEARINISNLRLPTFIGSNPEEKARQQDVIVKYVNRQYFSAFDGGTQGRVIGHAQVLAEPGNRQVFYGHGQVVPLALE